MPPRAAPAWGRGGSSDGGALPPPLGRESLPAPSMSWPRTRDPVARPDRDRGERAANRGAAIDDAARERAGRDPSCDAGSSPPPSGRPLSRSARGGRRGRRRRRAELRPGAPRGARRTSRPDRALALHRHAPVRARRTTSPTWPTWSRPLVGATREAARRPRREDRPRPSTRLLEVDLTGSGPA